MPTTQAWEVIHLIEACQAYMMILYLEQDKIILKEEIAKDMMSE
jgi:hypothetical protein